MAKSTTRSSKPVERTLDALPDTIDFRDHLFAPTLIRVPPISDLDRYRGQNIPVLDQGREGACTGFGLATVANYLIRARGGDATADEVSAWMLYAMAKRYDEWPGEDYEGSSARGAVKGWFKHGLCSLTLWKERNPAPGLDEKRAADAVARPLGAYFRVNHKDLVAMHSAITEVGILYATARVHEGWQKVKSGDETIVYRPGQIGGHAFAIVGYDRLGFWIQNSWGPDWGTGGLARLSYADWLANGTDVWVAALGAPVELGDGAAASMRSGAPRSYESQVFADLRPHIISSRNDGKLDDKGTYGLTPEGLKTLLTERMPATMAAWTSKRVLLYAHGGLVPESSAVQTVARNVDPLLKGEIYPLSFIWRSDAWSTIGNILKDAISRRRDEGLLDKAKDFMLDRIDDTLEVLARQLGGKALWDEMKENARRASGVQRGAARMAADHLIALHKAKKIDEIHLVGHSAGSIFHAGVAARLAEAKVPVASLTLWAPACTMELFDGVYRPLIQGGEIGAFDLYTLDESTEQDDHCANIYNKSLLYLVSHAFEQRPRMFGIRDGEPILGLERDAKRIEKSFWRAKGRTWHLAPGPASGARHHGSFDDDRATLLSTLDRIRGKAASPALVQDVAVTRAPSSLVRREFRQKLDLALRR
jgi:pimeloyl-ACP methyl ester carboxylesterase